MGMFQRRIGISAVIRVLVTGETTVELTRDQTTLVVKGVPVRVCANCGQEYVAEEIAVQLLTLAEDAAKAGVEVDVREYVAA
ncbi:MAG: YgiT-type zinc finger protein [Chloroflexi bacterium]|nr:YgiT-type zinc finger protein [Chloroflexota bacterium]